MIIRTLLFLLFCTLSHCQFDNNEYPPECDPVAARLCEYEFLQCRLFEGPADDPGTLCKCGKIFYGDCIRRANCQAHKEFDPLSKGEIYMKKCVDLLTTYNCNDTLICAINCASEGNINRDTSKVIPFNNYGATHLRIRICDRKVHNNQLKKYHQVNVMPCTNKADFKICRFWVTPLTFVPVALPKETTYMEIDYCETNVGGNSSKKLCHVTDPPPARVYGSDYIFPASFDVAQTNVSICKSDADCLGSYCGLRFRPHVCAPKTLANIQNSGKYYLSDKVV